MEEKLKYKEEVFDYFPFSKNQKKEINNRICDSDLGFNSKSPGNQIKIRELSKTMDQFGIKDPMKKANYVNFKLDLLGNQVHKLAQDRV
jgi:hypothetical protein